MRSFKTLGTWSILCCSIVSVGGCGRTTKNAAEGAARGVTETVINKVDEKVQEHRLGGSVDIDVESSYRSLNAKSATKLHMEYFVKNFRESRRRRKDLPERVPSFQEYKAFEKERWDKFESDLSEADTANVDGKLLDLQKEVLEHYRALDSLEHEIVGDLFRSEFDDPVQAFDDKMVSWGIPGAAGVPEFDVDTHKKMEKYMAFDDHKPIVIHLIKTLVVKYPDIDSKSFKELGRSIEVEYEVLELLKQLEMDE